MQGTQTFGGKLFLQLKLKVSPHRCPNVFLTLLWFDQVRMGGVACLAAVLKPAVATANEPAAGPTPEFEPTSATAPTEAMQVLGASGPFADPENQPLLAYIAHTLLGVAEGEAAAGAQGSRALRAAALRALRLLMERAGPDGGALAAILPGTASGLARALQVAGEAL